MAAYLTQQGYRSAAAVSANAGLERRTSQRIEGFCRYLAANNFPQPVRLDLENRSSISEGGKAMRRILDLPERPEVVFCANDDLAFGAMMACLVLAIIPIIVFYLVCQKYIVSGVMAGAVKG